MKSFIVYVYGEERCCLRVSSKNAAEAIAALRYSPADAIMVRQVSDRLPASPPRAMHREHCFDAFGGGEGQFKCT